MSQGGALRGINAVIPPTVPTSFQTDNGVAVPIGNVLIIQGDTSIAGTLPISTAGSTNIVTVIGQVSQAIAAPDITRVGLAAFDSTSFAVDADGFVTLVGGSTPFARFVVDTGNNPVVPLGGTITFRGAVVVSDSSPVKTNGTTANEVTLEVQLSQALAAPDVTKVGLSNFDSTSFAVDADGFVTLSTSGPALTITGDTGGALSTTGNNWNLFGTGSITTSGAVSTLTTQLTGLTNHNVLVGAGTPTITKVPPSATSGIALVSQGAAADPVFGTVVVAGGGTGNVTLTNHSVLIGQGTSPIAFAGPNAASGIPLISQGLAADPIFGTAVVAGGGTGATTFTANGVIFGNTTSPLGVTAAGTNGQVLIAATGAAPAFATLTSPDASITFVTGANSLSLAVAGGTTVGKTITGDSGGALAPTAGNWNILGRSGSKTAGSGSTITVNSPPFADQGASTSVTLNSGSFATATIALTTPVTAGLLDGDLLQFVATTANVLTIQFAATQVGHIGNQASSAAGTFVSTAIGDSLTLRYQASTNDWWATSVVGNWTIT